MCGYVDSKKQKKNLYVTVRVDSDTTNNVSSYIQTGSIVPKKCLIANFSALFANIRNQSVQN